MASSTSRWCSNAMNRAWRDRTLRILVQPTPITFAERRSILQVLQEKGEIEVFRQEKDHKARFIAVTKDEQTATDLLTEGFVSYNVAVHEKMPDITFGDLKKPDTLDATKGHIHRGESTHEVGKDGQVHRNFTIRVTEPQRLYNHSRALNGSPLNGVWPPSYTENETLMSSILKESLPQNITAKAFARWDYDLEDKGSLFGKAKRLQETACLPSRMAGPSGSGDNSVPAAVGESPKD